MNRTRCAMAALALAVALLGSASLPSSAATAVNLLSNGNFSNGLTGWSTNSDGCGPPVILDEYTPGHLRWDLVPNQYDFPAYSGDAVWLNACGGDTNPWISQAVAVTPGSTYQVSGYVRTGVGVKDDPIFGSFRVCVDDCTGSNNLPITLPSMTTDTWLPFTAAFTATSTSATVYFFGEVLSDSDYLLDEVAVTGSAISQVTDTVATCSAVFLTGDYPSLSAVQYATKRNAISQVNPGVFFYWAQVTLGPGGGTVLSQSADVGWSRWFTQAAGSQLFSTDCLTVKNARVATNAAGVTSVTGTGITSGTYYLAVKFAATSLVGATAPGTDPTYTFTSAVGAPAVELPLIRK